VNHGLNPGFGVLKFWVLFFSTVSNFYNIDYLQAMMLGYLFLSKLSGFWLSWAANSSIKKFKK
jgi:hypothetical protein